MEYERILQAGINAMAAGTKTAHCGQPATNLESENITWSAAYAEHGYQNDQPAKGILFADWNRFPAKVTDLLERLGFAIEWSDEWTTCSDCYRAVRTSENSYSWQPSYVILGDCDLVCKDCVDHFDVWIRKRATDEADGD